MLKRHGLFLVALLVIATGSLPAPVKAFADDRFGDLRFVSNPPLTASVGESYGYKAVATSGVSTAFIRYYSRTSVSGFVIDSTTGIVTWTPGSKGWFRINIIAVSSTGARAEQEFTVQVSGGKGVIQGTVRDTLGQPVTRVIVEAFSTQPGLILLPLDDDRGAFSYFAVTDSLGRYRISRVEPGTYKLHANAPSSAYRSQWYDGKEDAFHANVITVSDTPNVTLADFVLRSDATPRRRVTVTGTVKDTLGVALNPSTSSMVYFVRSGFALNSHSSVEDFREHFENESSEDFRLEGSSGYVFRANVDAQGAFSLQLPFGSYIAYARAVGYASQYFYRQSDIRSANVLNLQSDSTGIDFTLAALPPVAKGQISGAVLDSAKGVGVRSRVIVIRDRWNSPESFKIGRSYTFDTDSLGAFAAVDLLPGDYIVLAIPMGNYTPAYYSTDTTNRRWKKAARISINGNIVSGVNVYVSPLNPTVRGYAGVKGTVRAGFQSPVAGAVVYASLKRSVAGYSITDDQGRYEISGLSPNSYTLTVDMPGFQETSSQTSTVSYTTSGSPVYPSADFSVNDVVTSAQGGTSMEPEDFVLGQNYPNPFNPSTTINFRIGAGGLVTLKVFDVLGRHVATLVNDVLLAGVYSIRWDASNVASGVYYYRLQAGQSVETKRMVLMK